MSTHARARARAYTHTQTAVSIFRSISAPRFNCEQRGAITAALSTHGAGRMRQRARGRAQGAACHLLRPDALCHHFVERQQLVGERDKALLDTELEQRPKNAPRALLPHPRPTPYTAHRTPHTAHRTSDEGRAAARAPREHMRPLIHGGDALSLPARRGSCRRRGRSRRPRRARRTTGGGC